MRISYWSSDVCSSDLRPPCGKLLWGADYCSLRGTLMSEDMGAAGASALVTGRMSNRMNSQISVVGGRRRWSVEDRKSVVSGKSVSVRVGLGGRRIIKKKN